MMLTYRSISELAPEPSSTIRDKFDITGRFYIDTKNFSCREFLNIKRKDSIAYTPEVMVVMMNPGSSEPQEPMDKFGKEVYAKPDYTQYQIMRVMNRCEFNYARVLNLSDIREPKSDVFFRILAQWEKRKMYGHSIFCEERAVAFKRLFVKGVPVICAWGVDQRLSGLTVLAMEKIGGETIFGKKKVSDHLAYYHPLPRNRNDQKDWVEAISEQIRGYRRKNSIDS